MGTWGWTTWMTTAPCPSMSEQTIHVTFIDGEMKGASVVAGPVIRVAEDTMRDVVERQGHPAHRVSHTWAIDDRSNWAEAVYEGTVTLDGKVFQWRHVFTKAREPWPMLAAPSRVPSTSEGEGA